MSHKLNYHAYRKLVEEDLAWLLQQPRSLERDHIAQIVKCSPDHEYDPTTSGLGCGWYLASECLPEPGKRVLVTTAHGEVVIALRVSADWMVRGVFIKDGGAEVAVYAWRLLPEAYQPSASMGARER